MSISKQPEPIELLDPVMLQARQLAERCRFRKFGKTIDKLDIWRGTEFHLKAFYLQAFADGVRSAQANSDG